MDRLHIEKIIKQNAYPDIPGNASLIETHISWVILSQNYAFKIKKPLCYSFLDFSTLDKRKYFCERELELNQRLAKETYLELVPIRKMDNSVSIGGDTGTIIDYAVKMKRMDLGRQMNKQLEKNRVTFRQIEQLAEQLSNFHMNAKVVENQIDIDEMQADFADLSKVNPFIAKYMGKEAFEKVIESIDFSALFLKKYSTRILDRHKKGFTIDGHGDLHSKNIFLLDEPVIFDCIEFNDHFRQVDVLNEIAFLCMDLNFYGRDELETHFLETYLKLNPCIKMEEDHHIFNYYKLYRANIKVKVNALKSMQTCNEQELRIRNKLVKHYFNLLNRYLSELSASPVLINSNT